MISFKWKNRYTYFFFLCVTFIRCFSGKSLGFWIRQRWVCILILPFILLLVMWTWSNYLISVSSFLTWRSCLMYKVILRIKAVNVIPGEFMNSVNLRSFTSTGWQHLYLVKQSVSFYFYHPPLWKPFKDWLRAALVVQRFSAACSPGRDPGDPGSSPTSGSLSVWCLLLPLPVSLPLSLCLYE